MDSGILMIQDSILVCSPDPRIWLTALYPAEVLILHLQQELMHMYDNCFWRRRSRISIVSLPILPCMVTVVDLNLAVCSSKIAILASTHSIVISKVSCLAAPCCFGGVIFLECGVLPDPSMKLFVWDKEVKPGEYHLLTMARISRLLVVGLSANDGSSSEDTSSLQPCSP
jgi:hypothetical protein